MYSNFLSASILIGVYMFGVFILSLIKKDNSIVDTAYGIGFILLSIGTISFPLSLPSFLITIFVSLWAVRLSARIYLRNKGKPEDFRYKAWRDSWKWFRVRSFFQIYVLQGAIILTISSPIIFIHTIESLELSPNVICIIIGTILWLTGFFFEAVGDYQLDAFIKNNKFLQTSGQTPVKKIMDQGLWSLTRHPNYFGEVCMWWGVWIIALSVWNSFPFVWITIISPLLITFLLLKVSGIPMLEAKYKDDIEFQEYKKRTNAFFPWKIN
jgi:steroid 5-alpha reductase family enzyme